MSEPSASPAAPKKRSRALTIFLVVVVALVIYEIVAAIVSYAVSNNTGQFVGGVGGAVTFDENAQGASRSAVFWTTMLQAQMLLLCPFMLALALWGITSMKRKPAAPAPRRGGGAVGGN